MSNYDGNAHTPPLPTNAIAIDLGLRAFMLNVYNYMAAGVALTGVAALLTYQLTGPELLQSPLMWVLMLAPLALVFFIGARINTMSVEARAGIILPLRGACRDLPVDHLSHLHRVFDHAGVLCLPRPPSAR